MNLHGQSPRLCSPHRRARLPRRAARPFLLAQPFLAVHPLQHRANPHRQECLCHNSMPGAAPLICKGAGFDFPLPKTLRKSPVCSTYSRLTAEPASPSFLPSLPSQMHRWLTLVGSFFHAFCPPNESTRPASASLLPPTVGPAFRGGPLAPSFWHNHSWLCTRSNIAQTRTGKSACATTLCRVPHPCFVRVRVLTFPHPNLLCNARRASPVHVRNPTPRFLKNPSSCPKSIPKYRRVPIHKQLSFPVFVVSILPARTSFFPAPRKARPNKVNCHVPMPTTPIPSTSANLSALCASALSFLPFLLFPSCLLAAVDSLTSFPASLTEKPRVPPYQISKEQHHDSRSL
jgi:hypothetical protein